MLLFLKKLYRYIKKIFNSNTIKEYEFNHNNPLGGSGERVDIQLQNNYNYENFDMYQKNHFNRYIFAKEFIKHGEVCGDFACGTGYGSVMLSEKAKKVIGADLNTEVIEKIKERYKEYLNIEFENMNLLNLEYSNFFDTIISFETIEHFAENDISSLISLFFNALKSEGILIFSTPYMQEKTENAEKLGFHLTFNIDESKIKHILNKAGFKVLFYKYQNYLTHLVESDLDIKDFIICVAQKLS